VLDDMIEENWQTGYPIHLTYETKIEVEYVSGEREIAEVCEIDWSTSQIDNPWTCTPENQVKKWRVV
jgi:hypothetical protein